MFKLIGWVFKITIFAVIVLALGHLIKWDGKTISDQMKTSLSQAERSAPVKAAKRTASELLSDAKKAGSESNLPSRLEEKIPPAARKELKALLNSAEEEK